MKSDLLKIVGILIKNNEEADPLYVARSLRILKDEWPGLTEDEKKELMAVAHAVATLDEDIEDDDTYDDKKFPDYLEFESEKDNDEKLDNTVDTNAEMKFIKEHDISSDLSKFEAYYEDNAGKGLKRLFGKKN